MLFHGLLLVLALVLVVALVLLPVLVLVVDVLSHTIEKQLLTM